MGGKLKVTQCDYAGLPSSIDRDRLSGNGVGKEWANYIIVQHKRRLICCKSDAMEPEDVTFRRDLSWVADIIKEAYSLGFRDGRGP